MTLIQSAAFASVFMGNVDVYEFAIPGDVRELVVLVFVSHLAVSTLHLAWKSSTAKCLLSLSHALFVHRILSVLLVDDF